jgi:acetyl esterase/lipase
MLGGGVGIASADATGSSGSEAGASASTSAPSSNASKDSTAGTGTKTKDTAESSTTKQPKSTTSDAPNRADDQTDDDSATDETEADETNTDGDVKMSFGKHDSSPPKASSARDASKGPATSATPTPSSTVEPAAAEVVEPAVEQPATPAPEPVVEVVASAASTVVDSLSPGTTPEVPATQPQLWTLLAFARREFENALVPSKPTSRPLAELTSGEVLTMSDAPTAQIAAVESSLTYTGPPTIIDQVTVLGLRVLRAVSNVIGVDLFAEFNKLLISKSPPFFLNYGLKARQTEVELTDGTTWSVWEFQPPNPTGKTVIAIHGSGFIYEPNLMQWYDYTSMARDTGATVLVPIYPLATTQAGSALNVVPDMADYISRQIALHGADNVSVYGDSAGSIIAIAAVEQLVLAGAGVPSRMVLLSLTPDGSLSNPDIKNTNDPVVDVNNLGAYATSHWGDGLSPGDPFYNALHFDTLVGLPPTTIYVGSTEFVLPDTLLLYQKAVDEGAPISVVVGRGQIHDWALGGLPINSQAPVVRPDIYRQLGLA